jgi:hypothetical protein
MTATLPLRSNRFIGFSHARYLVQHEGWNQAAQGAHSSECQKPIELGRDLAARGEVFPEYA